MELIDDEQALISALEGVSGNFWAGEAEIVRAYFTPHRTRERDRVWLRH